MSIHPPEPVRAKITLPKLLNMKANGERIAMLTCYDACFAQLLDASGVDILLVGDSLGMVLQGHGSTLPVELGHMVYHTQCVSKGTTSALIMADMPFGSYAQTPEQAYASAAKLMAAGAQMVKLEGGDWLLPTVTFLAQRDIPVCSHLGLMPQSVNATGGYRIQGKTSEAAKSLQKTAQAMQNAGASMILLELVPAAVAADIRSALTIPLIGIGAGPDCDGQVLVLHDMLHINLNKKPKFVRNFMDNQPSIQAAVQAYVNAVKTGIFPGPEHTYNIPA